MGLNFENLYGRNTIGFTDIKDNEQAERAFLDDINTN